MTKSQDSTITQVFTEKQAVARLHQGTDPRSVWLAAYQPRVVSRRHWAEIGDFVRLQGARLDTSLDSLKRYCNYLTQLTEFAHFVEGLPLDVECVLDPDTVERFVASIDTVAARSTVRSKLRRLGRVLTRKAPWKQPPRDYRRRGIQPPYSSAEMAAINRDVRRQPTELLETGARRIVALGAGAGLDGRWAGDVRGTHITECAGIVRVEASNPERSIVAYGPYAEELLLASREAGENLLIGGFERGKNYLSNLVRRIRVNGGHVEFDPKRLRSTWIVGHLQAGVPMADLLYAAGVQNPAAFDSLIPYLTRSDSGAERLRGGDGL